MENTAKNSVLQISGISSLTPYKVCVVPVGVSGSVVDWFCFVEGLTYHEGEIYFIFLGGALY